MKKISFLILPFLLLLLSFQQYRAAAQAPPIIWQHCYGGDSADAIKCVKPTADGGFIAAGYTRSVTGDLAGNGGIKGLWVLKLDGTGTIQWEKTYNDTLGYANYIEPTSDGGYIVTGSHTVKLFASGSIDWVKSLTGNTIHQTSDGGYILAASFPGIVKLHADGSTDWQQDYSSSTDVIAVGNVCQSFTSGYIIAGNEMAISHPSACYGKTDIAGNLTLPIAGNLGHNSGGPFCKTNNAYLLGSNFVAGNFTVTEFDDNLTTLWNIGPFSSFATGIAATADSGFVTWSCSSVNVTANLTLSKFDANHTQSWTKTIPGTQADYSASVLQISNDNYVVSALISSNDTTTSGAHGGGDGWIAELGYNEGVHPLLSSQEIKVYPIPAASELFIDLPDGYENVAVRLLDLSGTTLISQNRPAHNDRLDLGNISRGMYLLEVINNGSIVRQKIVHF